MANLFGSICLSDIPKELIRTGKNGKKYLTITVSERRNLSAYGDTHYIKAYAKKGTIAEGTNLFIGDLKPSTYDNQQTATMTPPPPTPQQQMAQPMPSNAYSTEGDELPF